MKDIKTKVFENLKEGTSITFNKNNIAPFDDFLIFGHYRPSITCKFRRTGSGVWVVDFDGDEPMLLEDCPTSFFESIWKNIR